MNIKKLFKLVWNEFIYGGHMTSLGAVSVVFVAAILLNIKITWDFLMVVYLGTQIVYLYNRFEEFKKDTLTNPERTKYIKKYIKYLPTILLCFILIFIGILLYFNKIPSLLFGLLLLCLGLYYSKFFKKITEKIIGFKSFFTALLWTFLVIFLILHYSFPLGLPLILILIFVYLRIFINTNFSDIKDIESDKKEGLKTLPIVLGKNKLLQILALINIVAVVPIIYGFYLKLFPISSLMLFLTIPYTLYYFKKSENENVNPAFLYNVVVDSECILWLIFVLLGEFLL